MIDLSTLLLTAFYALFGILLMIVSNTIMDFFVPGDFAAEIKRGNCAVAWLSAGSFIGIGQILRAVILSPSYDAVPPDFVQGVLLSIVYFIIKMWHRKYALAEQIMRGNTAAGIFLFGVFVGLSLVIRGAVH